MYSYYAGPTPTGSSTSSTAAATSSTATPSSAATGLPTGWKYDGCYVDGAIGRIMNNQQSDNQQLTVESCVQTCSGLGYSVAGMEYSVQWYVLQIDISLGLINRVVVSVITTSATRRPWPLPILNATWPVVVIVQRTVALVAG